MRARLASYEPGVVFTGAPPPRSHSGVLVPLYEDSGELWVLLTRRSWELRSHRGEVSFPGGRQDPGEELLETAFREAREEIALRTDDIEILGELDRLQTVSSSSAIFAFVGLLPGPPEDLVPSPAEVDAILHVSVSELLLDEVFREELWEWADDDLARPIWFFELFGDTIWGATASMLRSLLSIGLGVNHA